MTTITVKRSLLEKLYLYWIHDVGPDELDDFNDEVRAALAAPATTPDVKAMANRLMGWPLPKDFYPDGGISFDGRKDDEWNKNKTWPIGTNLLTFDQAVAMFEYVLAPEQSRGTAQEQPSWQDAPTSPGVWLSDRGYENPYRWGIYNVVDPEHEKGMTLEDERWFGPISPDTGNKP